MRPALLALAGALVAALVALPAPAAGQAQCWPRAAVVKSLERQYGERPVARGITGIGAVLELFVAPEGRTWTVVINFPNGLACPLATGTAWDRTEPEPGGEPA